MRLLGKERYSLSLWSWLLQENLYIQGCKNSVLLPAFFFLRPKGPGEIICLWNFHFLSASLPGVLRAVHLGRQSKPSGLSFSQISQWARRLENPTGDSQMPFGFCILSKLVHIFTGEPLMRACQELCTRCWAFYAGLTHTHRQMITSR